jgi:signal transduction histidine kinase
MISVRTFLDRFRPAGAPGAATGAGVPSDRIARVATELAPVFDALAATMADCDQLRRTARSEATARIQGAAEAAAALLDRARIESEADRATAAAAQRQQAATAATRLVAAAEESARALRSRAEARRPDLVTRVRERVRARIEAAP